MINYHFVHSWVERYKEIKCCRIKDNLQHMAEVHSDMLQYLHSICNMWENNQVLMNFSHFLNVLKPFRKFKNDYFVRFNIAAFLTITFRV